MLLFVNRGKLSVCIDDEPFMVSRGQALLVLPGERVSDNEPFQEQLLCQWLTFRVRKSDRRSKRDVIQVSRTTDVGDPTMVAELFRQITEVFHRQLSSRPDSIVSGPRVKYLLLSLLSWLQPAESQESSALNALTFLAERARDLIRPNCFKPYTIAEVAETLECSQGHLRRAFRRTFGFSPGQVHPEYKDASLKIRAHPNSLDGREDSGRLWIQRLSLL